MKESFITYKDKAFNFWANRSKMQKTIILASIFLLIALVSLLAYFGTRTNFAPAFNVTAQEAGQIKEKLDARGIAYQISEGPNGTTVSVPETQVNTIKVELAAEGIPNSGNIDYGFIKDSTGFGRTDNEFAVINRVAMQTELGNLIRTIDGINDANVIITLPEESIWVPQEQGTASAAVILKTSSGYQLEPAKVRALYHLVSKSVPNLPIENITITDQNFGDYEYKDENVADTTLTVYEQQRAIKKDIERDMQKQLQQMLGMMMGQDKVLVSVTTDIDFTQEKQLQELVEPVDEENIEGIPISVERITEAYSGQDATEGIPGTGEGIPNYPGVLGAGNGEYERMEERINNEVNRIKKDIVASPYRVRDMGIQVIVEPPPSGVDEDDETPAQNIEEIADDIRQILSTVVRTSIDASVVNELTDDQINQKIFVSSQQFAGKPQVDAIVRTAIPLWMYIVGGVLVLLIILLIILLVRKNKKAEEEIIIEEEMELVATEIPELPDEDTGEAATKRKQLEKLAREKPEDFSKLIRTWLSED